MFDDDTFDPSNTPVPTGDAEIVEKFRAWCAALDLGEVAHQLGAAVFLTLALRSKAASAVIAAAAACQKTASPTGGKAAPR